MLKIDLFNPETEKTETFTEVFVPARAIRKVLEFSIKQEKESPSELETMDELVALIASLFRDERVNFDSIYDGIPSNKLNDELSRILADVMGGEAKKKDDGKGISIEEGLENLDKMYRDLMSNGWTYENIENMDISGFLRLMNETSKSKKFDDIEAFYNSI